MKIFGYTIKRVTKDKANLIRLPKKVDTSQALSAKEIEDIIRENQKAAQSIDKSIDEISGTDYRVMTIQDWLNAMITADQPWVGGYRANWVMLFDIFQNMMQDSHIQACVDTLKSGVQQKDFYIANQDGSKNEELTKTFQSRFMFDFMGIITDCYLWGFGLIQIQDFDGESKISLREVNRKHVRFDLGGIVRQQWDINVFKEWSKEPFKSWTIPVFMSKLGKLNACVRWWIYKTEIARIWAKYNQLMGIPPVIAKTSLKDKTRRENAITMLKNWLTSRWMVIDENDIVEGYSGSGSTSQLFFESLMRFCDEQISKALLNSTMVLDNGSSRSQGEVHEENTIRVINTLCQLSKFIVNDELLPRLQKIGFVIPKGSYFVWDNSEKMTMKERTEIVQILSNSYKVPEKTASEFVGIELEEKEIEQVDPNKFDKNEKKESKID